MTAPRPPSSAEKWSSLPSPSQEDTSAFTSDPLTTCLKPPTDYDAAAIQIYCTKALSNVSKPETIPDLFYFVRDVRRRLESAPALRWLLSPLPETRRTTAGNSIAMICTAEIRELIPTDIQDHVITWPARPGDLLDILDALVIKPMSTDDEDEPVPLEFPEVTEPESTTEFVKRVYFWVERYYPELNDSTAFSRGVAQQIYLRVRHCLRPQSKDEFRLRCEQFRTLTEVFDWFKSPLVGQTKLLPN